MFFSLIHLRSSLSSKSCVMCSQKKKTKLFKNVNTTWISMPSTMKCVMEQYEPLMANMHVDASRNNFIVKDMILLCDLELVLRLHATFSFLDFVHTFIKLA